MEMKYQHKFSRAICWWWSVFFTGL